MSNFDIATAFVRVLPDTTQFRALLQAQVNAAVAQVRVPGVAAGGGSVTQTANAAAAATQGLSVAATAASGASARQAAAALSLTRALEAERIAQEALAAATLRGAQAQEIQTLGNRAAIASQAVQVAQLRQAETVARLGAASQGSATGLAAASTQSKILQGSILGVSRITPVAVFGLGLYGSAAIGAGLAIKSSISSAAEFESQLNTLQAVTKATAAEMEQVRSTAIALGADVSLPAISAGDAAVALTELAKAGLSVRDSLDAARGVLQLSSAASISSAEAARITATQLNAFQLSGSDATRVAELLADASVSAQGEITDFAAAFGQVSAVANQVGLTIEDTTGLLTQLGKAGLEGSDGGTSLRTALLRLVPTTKEARQYTEALGIQIDRTKSVGEQIVPIIEQYRKQLQLLTPVQQQEVLQQIFGQDAIRAASILFTQQEGALRELTDEFERNNSIQDLSAAKAAGLKGAFGSLKSTFETIGIELGSLVDGPLEGLIRGLNDTVTGTENAIKGLSDLARLPDIVKTVKIVFDFELPGGGSIGDAVKAGLFVLPTGLASLAQQEEEAATPPAALLPQNVFGGPDFSRVSGVDEDRLAKAKADAARPLTAEEKRLRAEIERLKREEEETLKSLEIDVPRKLEQNLVDAQLKGSLQAELAADNAIVKYFQARLVNIKKGTDKFLVISGQLLDAQQQRDSVQNQINRNAEQAAAEQQKVADDLIQAEKDRAAAQEQLRQTLIDIETQRLDNRLQLALATPGTQDERRVFNAQIAFFERQKKETEAIKRAAKGNLQAQADAQLEIDRLNGQIIATRLKIKGLGKDKSSASSFTLQDLFQEAVDQFATFGSNISGRSGVLSPQDARASLARSVIGSADAATTIQGAQLTEAQKQTALLASIDAKIGGTSSTATQAALVSQAGNLGGWRAAREAAQNGYN